MTYEVYHWIFIGGAILAGLMLALAAVLFFYLQIPRVIGDLTGSTAKKAIEDIRQQNVKSGVKVYKSSAVNRERGKVTAKITPSGGLAQKQNTGAAAMRTDKLSTQKLSQQAAESVTEPAPETTVLAPAAAETTALDQTLVETTSLAAAALETTVLSQQSWAPTPPPAGDFGPFRIEYELTLIHSDERIA